MKPKALILASGSILTYDFVIVVFFLRNVIDLKFMEVFFHFYIYIYNLESIKNKPHKNIQIETVSILNWKC